MQVVVLCINNTKVGMQIDQSRWGYGVICLYMTEKILLEKLRCQLFDNYIELKNILEKWNSGWNKVSKKEKKNIIDFLVILTLTII